ncbi:mucin-like glycoprotein [Trypanosoma rangeli]|uniref:Mucin-like glycoprotein n=1 Tax=Trypanosoma rangeli TaxID=5698 RepID=A0A422MRG4_TRYRA|nr:mucin-like glycoprotein [Trypanosoma rangeli]RNE95805.1 mucin-like glycoprotein [Trypanosoma rangeli]|eukprot:RNE95805.1 mucin-like glycoprotein [Trypanosoma rangeli]
MLAVRRSAVCALVVLALLCGGCSPAWAEADEHAGKTQEVFVEFSCPDSDNKLSWRLPNSGNWKKCAHVWSTYSSLSGRTVGDDYICAWGGLLYKGSKSIPKCPESAAETTHAFTLKCNTDDKSGVYKWWETMKGNRGESSPPLSIHDTSDSIHTCTLQKPSEAAAEEDGHSPKTGGGGRVAANSAGRSDVAIVWIRAPLLPLLLLVVAAVACAAGE